MAFQEFELVVIGNEPAGLWLLNHCASLAGKAAGKSGYAWVSLRAETQVACPACLAELPQCLKADPWHIELVSPMGNLAWEPGSVASAFPELSRDWLEDISTREQPLRGAEMEIIRKALVRRPELLSFCSAVWKYVGRTRPLQPEATIWGALQCTKMVWWNPCPAPPVVRFEALEEVNTIEEVKKLKQGGLFLKLKGLEPIMAQKILLNLPYRSFEALSCNNRDLVKLLSLESDLRCHQSLYRLCVDVDSDCLPQALSPVTLYLDTDVIPEWDTEIWPIQVLRQPDKAQLVLYVSSTTVMDLDSVLSKCRMGFKRLNHLFPFLNMGIQHTAVPLSMASCFSQVQRDQSSRYLLESTVEFYDHMSFQTQTRCKGLLSLFPFVNCHLPYPVGTVAAARRLPEEIFGKKRWKVLSTSPSPSSLAAT